MGECLHGDYSLEQFSVFTLHDEYKYRQHMSKYQTISTFQFNCVGFSLTAIVQHVSS